MADQLVAHCRDCQPIDQRRGILQLAAETIDLKDLFEAPTLLEALDNVMV